MTGRKIDVYLSGAYGSAEFRAGYDAAVNPPQPDKQTAGEQGTFDFVITHLRGSDHFTKEIAKSTQYAKGKRLDQIRLLIGKGRLADLQPYHIENLMDRKGGPEASNRLLKELSEIYRYAARRLGYVGRNPTTEIDPRKISTEGFHTWTEDQVEQYRAFHVSGQNPALLSN